MKTITLENGTKVEISEESYTNLEKAVRPEFKVGGWYKWGGNIFRITKIHKNVFHTTDIDDPYTVRTYTYFHNPSDIYKESVKATPEEIKEYLIKEAERRGFKEGLPLRKVNPGEYAYSGVITGSEWDYIFEQDWLRCVGATIYKQGKWSEIVEDDTIMIGDYDVKVYSDMVQVGCQPVEFDTVKKIYKQMKKLRK